jgi:PAS domain-containing protein
VQTVIDGIPDATMVIDRDHRVVMANRAAGKMASGEDPVAERLTCHQLAHHSDVACRETAEPCPLINVFRTKTPITVKHTHYDADGNETLVEVSASPVFDEAGEVVEMIEVCRHVVEQPSAGISSVAKPKGEAAGVFRVTIEVTERVLLENALKATGGNKTAAAATLGMKASTFRDKLVKHGLG